MLNETLYNWLPSRIDIYPSKVGKRPGILKDRSTNRSNCQIQARLLTCLPSVKGWQLVLFADCQLKSRLTRPNKQCLSTYLSTVPTQMLCDPVIPKLVSRITSESCCLVMSKDGLMIERSCVRNPITGTLDGSGVKAINFWLIHQAWFFLDALNKSCVRK